jgi:endonuclease VIII
VPEGDTIHATARRLRDALAQRRVVRFELRRDPKGVRVPEPGTTVTAVEARGKHLLVEFDDGATLHTHMQLTGAWHVYSKGERWRRPGHKARVVLEVDNGTTAVCFDAPLVELRRGAARTTRATHALAAIGPDLCEPNADIDAVLANAQRCDADTPVGDVLLDQRVASGIGNVYKSEVCWAVGIDPATPFGALDAAQVRALFEIAQRFLVANAGGGRRVTYRNGLAVYGRAGRTCPRCRATIRRAHTGATRTRVTYWCPTCQPTIALRASR